MKLLITDDHVSTRLGHSIRQKRGFSVSLRSLARLLGTSAATLSRIERGVGMPRSELFVRLMEYLGINKNQFGDYTNRDRY